jgi:hypothetical protein
VKTPREDRKWKCEKVVYLAHGETYNFEIPIVAGFPRKIKLFDIKPFAEQHSFDLFEQNKNRLAQTIRAAPVCRQLATEIRLISILQRNATPRHSFESNRF